MTQSNTNTALLEQAAELFSKLTPDESAYYLWSMQRQIKCQEIEDQGGTLSPEDLDFLFAKRVVGDKNRSDKARVIAYDRLHEMWQRSKDEVA